MTDVEKPLRVQVVHALPERYWSVPLDLPAGATVAQALIEARLDELCPGLEVDLDFLAVFSRPVTPETLLNDGDRIEILRPLLNDPKQQRRERAIKPVAGKR
jgi:putative ubiquitin-RnfH superfamily antitoxin RatB of RatAB toxin-antitoxin module